VDEPLLLLWRRVSAVPCGETRVVRGLSPKAVCVCETSMVACLCVSFDCDSLSEELGRKEAGDAVGEMDFRGAGGSGSARPRERFGSSRLQSRSESVNWSTCQVKGLS